MNSATPPWPEVLAVETSVNIGARMSIYNAEELTTTVRARIDAGVYKPDTTLLVAIWCADDFSMDEQDWHKFCWSMSGYATEHVEVAQREAILFRMGRLPD